MWDLNVLFWLIAGAFFVATASRRLTLRLAEMVKRYKETDSKNINELFFKVFFKDIVLQIVLTVLGFYCLMISVNEAHTIGKRKIMTPRDLGREIYKVEQQMKVPDGAVVAIRDGKKTGYLVLNPFLLSPETSHVEKRKEDTSWVLVDSEQESKPNDPNES